jgi:hypothetical protein
MPVPRIKFVLVNDMVSCEASNCTQCARPLHQGYLRDLSTSNRYCGIECYPRLLVSETSGPIAPANPLELTMAWPQLTFNVAPALFDSAWSRHD